MSPSKRRRYQILAAAVALLLFLVLYIEDWGRDFTTNEASISAESGDPSLKPVVAGRSREEVVEAIKMAGRRIRNWEYIGDTEDGNTTLVVFVRTNRLLRFKDDILLRVEEVGDRRIVTGNSRSRLGLGDLGRNPRNLRRILAELREVLEGAAPKPVMTTPEITGEP